MSIIRSMTSTADSCFVSELVMIRDHNIRIVWRVDFDEHDEHELRSFAHHNFCLFYVISLYDFDNKYISIKTYENRSFFSHCFPKKFIKIFCHKLKVFINCLKFFVFTKCSDFAGNSFQRFIIYALLITVIMS